MAFVTNKGLSGGVRGVNAPEGVLSGKTALVIGASSGIGLEAAKLFADAGAKNMLACILVIGDRDLIGG